MKGAFHAEIKAPTTKSSQTMCLLCSQSAAEDPILECSKSEAHHMNALKFLSIS